MKRRRIFQMLPVAAMLMFVLAFTSCEKADLASDQTTQTEETSVLTPKVAALTPGVLDSSEITTLVFVREEELMARDIYLAMKAKWNHVVFKNIANSEQAHATAILKLLTYYQIPDPAAAHVQGVFTNPDIQALHDALLTQGNLSLIDAFTVGATIEDYDIHDLNGHIANDIDNINILKVLNNLRNGSKAHIRAFNRQLEIRGVTYVPQFISQAEFDAIIN
jgi:hypothetical protein